MPDEWEKTFALNPNDASDGNMDKDNDGYAAAETRLRAIDARRHFGYPAGQVAAVLGYRSHSGVSNAIARIESAGPAVQRTAQDLARKIH